MVDMEEGRRNQIRSFFGCTLGERNEKYKKGISAFLVFLSNRFFHLRRGLEYRGTDSEGICGKAEMDDGGGTSGHGFCGQITSGSDDWKCQFYVWISEWWSVLCHNVTAWHQCSGASDHDNSNHVLYKDQGSVLQVCGYEKVHIRISSVMGSASSCLSVVRFLTGTVQRSL